MLIHSRFRRWQTVLGIGTLMAVLLLSSYLVVRPTTSSVRGILVNVEAISLIYADRVVLRDDEGRNWTFRVSPEVAQNPTEPQSASHLRQHMVVAGPVRIYYRATSQGPLAVRIVDEDDPIY